MINYRKYNSNWLTMKNRSEKWKDRQTRLTACLMRLSKRLKKHENYNLKSSVKMQRLNSSKKICKQ